MDVGRLARVALREEIALQGEEGATRGSAGIKGRIRATLGCKRHRLGKEQVGMLVAPHTTRRGKVRNMASSLPVQRDKKTIHSGLPSPHDGCSAEVGK